MDMLSHTALPPAAPHRYCFAHGRPGTSRHPVWTCVYFPSSTLYLQEPQHRRSCLSRSGNLEVLLPQEAALPLIALLQHSKSMASVPGPCEQSCSDPPPSYVAACRLWLMTKTAAPGIGLFLRAAAFDSLQRREDE